MALTLCAFIAAILASWRNRDVSSEGEDIITMTVAAAVADSGSMMVTDSNSNRWYKLGVDEIKGFSYEEGYEYTLQVKRTKIPDGFSYELVQEVNKSAM